MFVKHFADEICKGRECLSVIKILAEPDFNGSLLCTLMGTGSLSECRLKLEDGKNSNKMQGYGTDFH